MRDPGESWVNGAVVTLQDASRQSVASRQTTGFGQPFKLTGSHVATFEDGTRGKDGLQSGHQERFPLIHTQRGKLDDQHIGVAFETQGAH